MLSAGRMLQRRNISCSRVLRKMIVESKISAQEVDAAQSMRTVNRVTPGKFFMFNFIAGEQSTISIANRVNSVIAVGAFALAVPLYGSSAIVYSWVVPTLGIFSVISMHYHVGTKASAPLAAVALLIFLFKCFVESE
eukprot:TRINITY_DN4777_c4_g1_i1.p1 TRINITY_DN4777_c4_g1~~TRINITY_DN4777_c4_g1_i1.p1  ORF type:complete len:137 (+),score=13.71 TRINITY_DN4777_c4_g1_i1:61-471(+)